MNTENKGPDYSDSESSYGTSELDDPSCAGCHKKVVYCHDKWYTCTICLVDMHSTGLTLVICPACYDAGFHADHYSHISQFQRNDEYVDCYTCDGCGAALVEKDRLVYACKTCGIHDYGLCSRCYKNGFHIIHKDSMTKLRALTLAGDNSDLSDTG